ncbi:GntR family transcriptional regulator [Lentilactobacillus laojiaonis]|uniref:GntR family transcriptional regulator n=1 Tax=Lentilactobacillus laojiaonis TaxID=2883998 RepID=UPI001D0ABEA8|nr:GntR family transcriptional regulator [Lentilactobacillus laojiaonis]UDM31747.1 GntR family transcriptional regulator [Lentilactobacillus laojiaonis]
MKFKFNDTDPIYLQVANQIEDAIFNGSFLEEEQIPSTTEISKNFHINPATVLKGMNILVNKSLIYKKRGLGMFVSKGAREIIIEHRKELFYDQFVTDFVREAKNLHISEANLLDLIKRGYNK